MSLILHVLHTLQTGLENNIGAHETPAYLISHSNGLFSGRKYITRNVRKGKMSPPAPKKRKIIHLLTFTAVCHESPGRKCDVVNTKKVTKKPGIHTHALRNIFSVVPPNCAVRKLPARTVWRKSLSSSVFRERAPLPYTIFAIECDAGRRGSVKACKQLNKR